MRTYLKLLLCFVCSCAYGQTIKFPLRNATLQNDLNANGYGLADGRSIELRHLSSFPNAAANTSVVYIKTDGKLYIKNAAGVEVEVGGGGSPAWADITGKPTEFTPSAHNQAINTITGLQTALDGKLDLTGGTLSGNVVFSDAGEGVTLPGGATIRGTSGSIVITSATDQNIEINPGGTGRLRQTAGASQWWSIGPNSVDAYTWSLRLNSTAMLTVNNAGLLNVSAVSVAGQTIASGSFSNVALAGNTLSVTGQSTVGGLTVRRSGTSLNAGLEVVVDPLNGSLDALYILPPSSSSRVYFGKTGQTVGAINYNNASNENFGNIISTASQYQILGYGASGINIAGFNGPITMGFGSGNRFVLNQAGVGTLLAPSYATPYTPTISAYETKVRMTVTGPLTLNAPTAVADGDRVIYYLTASGATRTITLGSGIIVPVGVVFDGAVASGNCRLIEIEKHALGWFLTRNLQFAP